MMAHSGQMAVATNIKQMDKCFYSITGCGTLRSNSKYNVAISIHKADESCEVKITLKGPSYEDSKTIEVQPMTTQIMEFDVPELYDADYELMVEGLKGLIFQERKQLNFQRYKPIICIQTDKAIYKPEDLVRFRVLFMNENTQPIFMNIPICISIIDGERNRLKQWKNIELKKGVFVEKYQLSEQPLLGQWYIDVSTKGESLEKKIFQVDKYVLPKFDVKIETARHVAIFDGVINVTIHSKYTYGKAVKGKAKVSIKPICFYSDSNITDKMSIEKTIEINGKGCIQFIIGKDFKVYGINPVLKIQVIMEEAFTGNTVEAKTNIQLHENRFRFEGIELPCEFKPGKSIKFCIVVELWDDTPVLDTKNPVKLLIRKEQAYSSANDISQPEKETNLAFELSAYLDECGIVTFEHIFPEDCEYYYYLSCSYLDCTAHLTSISKFVNPKEDKLNDTFVGLQLNVLTKKLQLGSAVKIQVRFNEPIPYFIYTVVGRGKLLKAEYVTVAKESKDYIIQLQPTFDMVPSASIFVHFVDNKELYFADSTIRFERELQNFINITAPTEAQLGENITLQIESETDAYVGLLGVDQSVLLLRNYNNFSEDEVLDKLEQFESNVPYCHRYEPGSLSGLIIITNANYQKFEGSVALDDFKSRSMYFPQAATCLARIRKEFPETWIFEDIEILTDGSAKILKTVPDTITSWVITGFSLHSESGLGITKMPSFITAFRPFFISTTLPYSLKRGEQFSLPVLIFNYMDQDVEAVVTLDNADTEFEFVEDGDDQTQRVKNIKVTANNSGGVNFIICPKKIGEITLKIKAVSPLAGDAVHKKLKVEPEGITVFKNRDYYLHADEGMINVQNFTSRLDIPKDVVPDSEYIEVSVMGNILSTTIMNIDELMRMPYGCGEQNMVNFVPNILVLWYLESMEELSNAIEMKAKRFLEIGYQRELTYKHDDGSYSAFGKSDDSGSTWLTAYVMRSFHQAKKYIDIDPQILESGLEFLAKTQAPSGGFPEVGRVIDFAHINEFGLTAFVLLAYLENTEYMETYKKTIDRAFEHLQQQVKDVENTYALAIALYAFQKRQSDVVHEILAKLETVAIADGGLKWWTQGKTTDDDWRASSNDVEITAYVLMALLEMGNSVLPITKWLITQRNSNGGFQSTQDTVVGLWALIKFAEQSGATNPDISVEVSTATSSKTFNVKKENSLVMQSWELSKDTREVTFSGKGSGSCIIQVSYRYNILEKERKPSFKLSTKVKPKVIPTRISMDVFAEFVPLSPESGDVSNMAVMEVALPSGYIALQENFDKIKKIENVKRVETKNGDTNIVVYFDSLKDSEVKCIPIEAEILHDVAGQKPVPIVIYDYYDNKKRDSIFYQIQNILSDF